MALLHFSYIAVCSIENCIHTSVYYKLWFIIPTYKFRWKKVPQIDRRPKDQVHGRVSNGPADKHPGGEATELQVSPSSSHGRRCQGKYQGGGGGDSARKNPKDQSQEAGHSFSSEQLEI